MLNREAKLGILLSSPLIRGLETWGLMDSMEVYGGTRLCMSIYIFLAYRSRDSIKLSKWSETWLGASL